MAQTGFTPILLYSSSTGGNAPAAADLTNNTTGSELAINITDGKLFYKDNANAVQVIGWKTTPTTAGGTGLTSWTAGDLPYYATGTTLSKLGIGSSGQILTSTGTAPQWSTLSGVAVTTFSAGTTGLTPSSATSGAITLAGTLATTNGGTGLTSFTANGILYASSTSALATGSSLTFDGTNFATTGSATATRFIPSGSTVPTNGLYLPATNAIGWATNSTAAMRVDASQNLLINQTTTYPNFGKIQIQADSTAIPTNQDWSSSTPAGNSHYVAIPTSTSSTQADWLLLRGTYYGNSTTHKTGILFQDYFRDNGQYGGMYIQATGGSLVFGDLSNGTYATTNASLNARITLAAGGAVTMTGTVAGASFRPTSSTVPTNGMYLPAANSVGIATNSTGRIWINSSGQASFGSSSAGTNAVIDITGTSNSDVVFPFQIFSNNRAASLVMSYGAISASGGLVLYTSGTSSYYIIDANGNMYGKNSATNMTNGFFYIPGAAGAPSGTPTAVSGHVPMYYDTTNNKFYVYNGAWKGVTLA